jgi:hypothetical protein
VRWTPGTVNDYSNFGYCVLGAVVEKVTGSSYASWVTANVLSPAGASGIVQSLQPASTTSWYGFGWTVNDSGNWWPNGSLPGTTTEQIRTADGWGFAAFFNSRPSDSNTFDGEVDAAPWNAFNGVSTWETANLFDQYGAYTGWMTGATYQATFNSEAAAGKYPSRVEGGNVTGTPLFRAVFAPVHSSNWTSSNGIDCPMYESKAATLASEGYETASLQSFVSNDGTRRYQATWVKW